MSRKQPCDHPSERFSMKRLDLLLLALLIFLPACSQTPAGSSTAERDDEPRVAQRQAANPPRDRAAPGEADNPNQDRVDRGINIMRDKVRVPLTIREFPWRSLGIVYVGKNACSGVLVGPDLVLTAAHCVMDSETGELRTDIDHFYAAVVQNQAHKKSWIKRVWWGSGEPQKSRHLDWAICRLEDRLGDELGWYQVADTTGFTSTSMFPETLIAAGYSGDYEYGGTATMDQSTRIRNITSNGLLLHDGSMTRGSSGCPLFTLTSENEKMVARIYALNVAEYRQGKNDSLELDTYSDEFANIAIPTSIFNAKLNELLAESLATEPEPAASSSESDR